jgi:hypothetical protein
MILVIVIDTGFITQVLLILALIVSTQVLNPSLQICDAVKCVDECSLTVASVARYHFYSYCFHARLQ